MIYARKTLETDITITLSRTDTVCVIHGLPPFLKHLMTLFFFYSNIGCQIEITDDQIEDNHHLFEDFGIALGAALKGFKEDVGCISRFSTQYRPMDEALVRVVLDLSGRSGFFTSWSVPRPNDVVSETIEEFYKALSRTLSCTLHLDILKGENRHHIHEACFKALGAAFKEALMPTTAIQSTKGVLDS